MSNDSLERLAETLEARKQAAPETSYVAKLFSRGEDAILKKIGEEATEVVMAAKDADHGGDRAYAGLEESLLGDGHA